MGVSKPKKISSALAKPVDKGLSPRVKRGKKDVSLDSRAMSVLLKKLLKEKGVRKLSLSIPAAPVLSTPVRGLLLGFIVHTLRSGKLSELFKDKPFVLKDAAEKICRAIERSPNMIAKVLHLLNSRHS